MKTCTRCKTSKSTDEFHKNKSRRDGLQSMCKSCMQARNKVHYQENKAYYFDKAKKHKAVLREKYIQYKESMPCTDCGIYYPSYVTQFDHTGSDKEFNVANKTTGSWDKLLREMQKCELVCANCHAVRTWKRRQ